MDMQEVKLFVLPLRSSFKFRANETHQKITDRAMLELMVFLVEYRNSMYNYIPRELAKSIFAAMNTMENGAHAGPGAKLVSLN